ncbi:MAG: DUF5688 family protein [Saccharofermentans sp.]|nr:DUF5688 family protein [Saccharofermentans sp.]
MMDFEEFRKRVLDEFMDYMPERYFNCKLVEHKVSKVNEELTGITITPKDKKGSYVAPTFYLERMYEQYLEEGNFERTMVNQAKYLEDSVKVAPKIPDLSDLSSFKNKIIFQLISKNMNASLIEKCPHREFEDLTVIYRAITHVDQRGLSGFIVTNEVCQSAGWSEEDLYEHARKNTPHMLPFMVERIEQTLLRLVNDRRGSKVDMTEEFPGFNNIPNNERVYVVTNSIGYFGADALLYPDVIKRAADIIGTDCYVLPSSIHDLIILSAEFYKGRSKLLKLVKDTNMTQVSSQDKLSDSVYLYSRADNQIRRVASCDVVA